MTDNTSTEDSRLTRRLRVIALAGIVGVPALALGLVALALPTHSDAAKTVTYQQTGQFGYTADAPADSVYGPGGLSTGEAIVSDIAGPVTLGLDYRLRSAASKDLTGSVSMQATVELPAGLKRVFPMKDKETFTGDVASISARLPVDRIVDYVDAAEASLGGSFGSTTTVTVQPVVKVTGSLSAHPLDAEFTPELRFLLVQGVFTMDTASSDPSADPDADPLKPESSGKLDYRLHAERTMSMVVGEPSVTDVRKVGLGVGGLCLLLGLLLGLPLLRDQEGAKSAARIQLRYGERIVPVSDLALGDGPVADVSSIDALADLAKRYESVIMHATVDGAETYLVWDNGFTYRYQPTDAGSTSETEPDPLERALSDHDWDAFAELSRDEHEHRPG